MNISVKQPLTLKDFLPATGLSWFIKRFTLDAILSRVRTLLWLEEEQEEHPDDEPMPAAVALLLRRVDDLAAQNASLEECIDQIEREPEWEHPRRNRHLSALGSWWRLGKRHNRQEERRGECLTGRI